MSLLATILSAPKWGFSKRWPMAWNVWRMAFERYARSPESSRMPTGWNPGPHSRIRASTAECQGGTGIFRRGSSYSDADVLMTPSLAAYGQTLDGGHTITNTRSGRHHKRNRRWPVRRHINHMECTGARDGPMSSSASATERKLGTPDRSVSYVSTRQRNVEGKDCTATRQTDRSVRTHELLC
jgi:hypothetical protein